MANTPTYNVAVAWRIYPKVSKNPLLFKDDKFAMVENSLLSFINCSAGLKIYYYFILDGCPEEYTTLLHKLFNPADFTITETNSIGNGNTFAAQIDILSKQDKSDVVYFAEDDYLYVPGEFNKAVEFIKEEGVDFISCYMPLDVFRHPIHNHRRHTKYSQDKLWMSASSTCLTFMTTKKTLIETRKLLLTYQKGNRDTSMWLILTHTFIYNPFAYLRFITHKECFSIMKMAVKYSFIYFFTTRKYRLWMPYTAICTHLESGIESPGVDWISISKNVSGEK